MNSDNIVMWVTRLSIFDWFYFKTQTLLATLEVSKSTSGQSYVSSEAEHLNVSIPQYRVKSFRWLLDCEWMDYLLSTFGT